MIRKTPWLIAVSAVASLSLLASCATQAPPAPPHAEDSSEAGQLFQANCSQCHGPNREGSPNVAPALFLYGVKDTRIRDTIANGVPETAMPAFGDRLNADEIDALIEFLKTPPAGK